MQRVSIAGIGQTPVREHWDQGLRELGAAAIRAALEDARLDSVEALFVGNMLSGPLSGQEHLGPLLAETAGLSGVEAVKVEAACASGAAAFRQALLAVASGWVQSAIAVGVEKLTETSVEQTTDGLATAADAEFETAQGLSFVALNALLMRRYMHQYGYRRADFAPFVVQAHQNAVHNSFAMFREPISVQAYLQARPVADPIALLDASPVADGAAAVVLLPAGQSAQPYPEVEILACQMATDTIALDERRDPLWLSAVEASTARALHIAGITRREVDFFELHDAFSIMSALSLEASGFAEKGEAVRLAGDGRFSLQGPLPICTMGGLKARGHPVGATGIYQIVEATLQLQGRAPEPLQLDHPRIALAQNIGGTGATVITTVLATAGKGGVR